MITSPPPSRLHACAGLVLVLAVLPWGCRIYRPTVTPTDSTKPATLAAESGTEPTSPGPADDPAPPGELSLRGDVSVLALDLTESNLSEIVALPAMILYFSTTCPHCWNVAGEFQSTCDRLAGHGVDCLGVVSSSSRLGDIRDFAEQTGTTVPLVSDYAGRYRDAHGMTATPTAIYFGSDGRAAFLADPFFRGASQALEMAAATDQGRDPNSVWRPGEYLGTRSCAACHEVEYNSWLLSPHSVAIMRMPGETYLDETCLRCHATATGEPGGFTDLINTRHLRDVGCEACHGPAGGHQADGTVSGPDPTAGCLRCHDADHSIAPDVPTMVAAIDHQLAEALPRDRWNRRRFDLEEGEAPRVALQIPAGECVGSEACKDCHENEYRAWSTGPHGTAMQTLRDAGSHKDPACVACHRAAYPCRGGPKASREPGISCEACHGPGAAHIASGERSGAPGDGPILGLRPAHQPECVIEPSCRTCHTKLRDARWDLQTRLAGVHPTASAPPPDPTEIPGDD